MPYPLFRTLAYGLLLLLLTTCGTSRNLVYFSNLQNTSEYTAPIENSAAPTIQPDDIISITVKSLNPESNLLFNNGVLPTIGAGGGLATTIKADDGYLVGRDGAIDFPILGRVQVAGLTKAAITNNLIKELRNHVKNPIVAVRFINFRITVIGEVARPATFLVTSERINILEALGLAGDMTAYGRRDNVLLIREADGTRKTTRLNLNDKAVLSSPYFYLQQNDVVYVEPDKSKALQASTRFYYVPIALTAISVISILFSTFR